MWGYGSGPANGSVAWSGDALGLSIEASGEVAPINISGTVEVRGYSIGDVSAARVGTLWAYTSVGDVSAAQTVYQVLAASGDVGTVTAGASISAVTAGGSIESVTAGEWIGGVGAWLDVGPVTAGTYIGSSVAALGGGVSAGRDVIGPVTAGLSIERVAAGRDILGGVKSLAGDVWVVEAGGSVAEVKAARDVHYALARGDLFGPVTAEQGFVYRVVGGQSVLGRVEARTDVGIETVRAPEPWAPNRREPTYLDPDHRDAGNGVTAREGDVAQGVTAQTGSITEVRAGRDVLVEVSANVDVGRVEAGRDVTATVTAGAGIGPVKAGGRVSATVAAGTDVAGVEAGEGIFGQVTAGRDVGSVSVYPAAPDPGSTYDIGASVTAGRDVGGVSAPFGNVSGGVNAAGSIVAGVEAGLSIVGELTAGIDIGGVVAGSYAGGSIGAVTAGGNIASVVAYGRAGRPSGSLPRPSPRAGLDAALWSIDPAQDVYVPFSLPASRPERAALEDGGDVLGPVTAGGHLGGVTAFGAVAGTVSATTIGDTAAGSTWADVWALGDVTGSVRALTGSLDVESWGRIGGSVSAPDGLSVWGYGDVAGGLASRTVKAGSWGSVTGSVSGELWADVRAFGDIGGGVGSASGWVTAWAGGSVLAGLSAGLHVAAHAGLSFSGPARSELSDTWIFTRDGGISGHDIWAKDLVRLSSGTDVTGASVTSAQGRVFIEAGGSVTVAQAVANGNLWVFALGAIDGGALTSQTGDVWAEAGADLRAPVTAHRNAYVSAVGTVYSPVTAETGVADVYAFGDVEGAVRAEKDAFVETYGNLSGAVSSNTGAADVWAAGSVSGRVQASATATVNAGGDVSGGVTAGTGDFGGDAVVVAGGYVYREITARGVASVTGLVGVAAFIDGLVAVDIYSGGAVAGSIVSAGSVSAESLGDFFASVEAIGDVSVVSGGNVAAASGLSSVIRAGDEWSWSSVELFAEGDVSVAVDATGSVTIAAGGDVTRPVTAGEDADVEAGGLVSGAISAGGAAYVEATDDVSGPVVAWGDAHVWSQGSVTASVTSQAGEAELQVEGTVSGDVSADLDVWIDAGGDVAGTVTAGNDDRWSNAFVRAGGNVTGAVSATWLAEIEAGGDVIGAVVAHGGDAVVTAGGDITGPVSSADGGVELWAWGGIEGNVLAEDAVLVVAFGTVTGGIDSESDEEELLSLGDDTAEAGPGHEAADPTGQMAAGGWLDTLDRAGKVTTFLARQSAADQDALAGWWAGASALERANLLKELLRHAHSDGEMYTVLLTRIRPPEAEELPPPTPVRPPTTPPTPEQLKQWEAEAKQAQKDRDALAEKTLKEADDDDALRKKLSKGWFAQADRMRDARERGWIRRFFGAQHYAPPDRYGEEAKLREWAWQAADKVNYEIKDGKVIGITEEGKRRQAVWDRVAKITAMSTTEKLKEVLKRVSEDNLLSQELRERVKELMQPVNLAVMGGAMGVLGAVAVSPWGPPVMGVVGVLGYVLLGVSVIDVSKDLYMSVATTLGARSDADFDKAALLFSKGISKAALDAGMAAAGFGVTKAVQAVGKAKKAAALRADGKVEVVPPPAAKPPARNKGTPSNVGPLPAELAALRASLVEKLTEKVISAVTKGIEGDPGKLKTAFDNLTKIISDLQKRDWSAIRKGRRLESDEQIAACLETIFVDNMAPGTGVLRNLDRQAFLNDLALISNLEGFQGALRNLLSNLRQVRGNVAEVMAAAADRRAGKLVEDISVKVPRPGGGVKTDIDLIADGTLWQLKVGDNPLSIKDAAIQLAAWSREAIAIARSQGKTNIGYRFDKEAMKRYTSEQFQKLLEVIKKDNPDIKFRVEEIPSPDI